MVIILFMCRRCDTVICSPTLCEWLLYCSCVFTLIQSLKEQIEAKEEVLNVKIETQKQLQTRIDDQTKREEANNRTVQELREKQKELQATINELIKTVEPDVSTCKVEAVTTSKWSENLPSINVVKYGTNTNVSYTYSTSIIRVCVGIFVRPLCPLRFRSALNCKCSVLL